MRLRVDGTEIEARESDTVLVALGRVDRLPTGSLCGTGDCPHCLATIDGRPHRRMCATPAAPGMVVTTTPVDRLPELPSGPAAAQPRPRNLHTDVVIIGAGVSGSTEADRLRSVGRDVVVVEQRDGAEAIAVYHGPMVLARIGEEVVRLHCSEVVVATGRMPVHPVVLDAPTVLLPAAAESLIDAGVDVTALTGTIVIDAPTTPRDLLYRMAGGDPAVRVIGGAALPGTLPACPDRGTVCPCSGVTIEDLEYVSERGFDGIELLKRATLAGTGVCQGAVCSPYLRSFVESRGRSAGATFTARPPVRPITVGEAGAGFRLPAVQRTALDGVHRGAGARMDRIGGWWRPWVYPDTASEYRAVREAVSLCDVGTLGKMIVRGPDAVEFLERLYPCRIADIRPGRTRYALLLAESGGLMDDGLISRVDDDTFHLSFTSGGASHAEAWVRDWAHAFDADIRIMDRTHSLGAINVTGPRATELLDRVGMDDPLRFMTHGPRTVAGIPCHVYRLSFTGEVSYELHHPIRHSVELWERLMDAGADLGVFPHGLQTLQTLRLEKGHIIIGMDTEPDSTPRRLGMDWAVTMDKGDFVGRDALARTARLPVRKRLVGLSMDGAPPVDGTPLYVDDTITGYVTSAAWSPTLARSVMLAWIDTDDGAVPATVTIGGGTARHVPTPFYDPEGDRARG